MRPRWVLPDPPDAGRVAALAAELELDPTLLAVLVRRGIERPQAVRDYLRPLLGHLHPPALLPDAPQAADRILGAIRAGESVLVHGDYDVDGICGVALLTRVLRSLGARVIPFVPHRLKDGYDFGAAGLAAARDAGARLILTVDCGVLANEWIRRAGQEGIDVVVTDHHLPGPELPPAVAVVNPARADSMYPEQGLCGTGVAWKLCCLLAERCGLSEESLLCHLDLVALATVADLVPLKGENRVLVRYGLRALSQTGKTGLLALLRVSGLEVGPGRAPLEAGQAGFALAPRINAVGRMGDAMRGLRLLLSEDPDEAEDLAGVLDEENRERQAEDRRTLEQALELLADDFDPDRDYGVVLAVEGWHPGVIGIAASRVVERIHRPVVMVALRGGHGRGSARSIPGFDVHEAISACGAHLERFGGHAQAAGLELSAEAVPAFRDAFANEARLRLEGRELRPHLRIDLELPERAVERPLVKALRYTGPHGIGNPRPTFLLREMHVVAIKAVSRGHLRVRVRKGDVRLDGIGFGLAERHLPEDLSAGPIDVVFQLVLDLWRGEERVQARILDLRPSGQSEEGRLHESGSSLRTHAPGARP